MPTSASTPAAKAARRRLRNGFMVIFIGRAAKVPHAGIGGLAPAFQNGKVGSWELGHRRGGGAAGAALAYAAFDNFRAATMNWPRFSQVTFAFVVGVAVLDWPRTRLMCCAAHI